VVKRVDAVDPYATGVGVDGVNPGAGMGPKNSEFFENSEFCWDFRL
jgi:hypothetical protein